MSTPEDNLVPQLLRNMRKELGEFRDEMAELAEFRDKAHDQFMSGWHCTN